MSAPAHQKIYKRGQERKDKKPLDKETAQHYLFTSLQLVHIMEANISISLGCLKPLQFSFNRPIHLQILNRSPCLRRAQFIRAVVEPDTGNEREKSQSSVQQPLQIRFKRGARRRARELEQAGGSGMSSPPPPPKEWEMMTLQEKAAELYMGEKGLLYWLNKAAYASIFIIIGAWILFRFVGPSLNLYQLDVPQ